MLSSRPLAAGLLLSTLLAALLAALLASCGRLAGSGGGSSANSHVVVLPPLEPAPPPASATLLSAVPAADRVLLSWVSENEQPELALFTAESTSTLYDGPPLLTPLTGNGALVTGFTPGSSSIFGLAVADGTGGFTPSGAVLSTRFADPIYVDLQAPPGGDGLTPVSAYKSLLPALIDSLISGGSNIWATEGAYPPGALPLFPGTHLYGGFTAAFDLLTRDPVFHATTLSGVPGQPVLSAAGPGLVVLDGLLIDGRQLAKSGVQALDAPLELRGCAIVSNLGPGIRLKSVNNQDAIRALVTGSLSSGNGAEGLSANGAFNLFVHASRFESNVQEGLDFCDLSVTHGRTGRATLCDSRFAGNGSEGADMDMSPAITGGAGDYLMRVRGCRFESNATAGLLIDIDFDTDSGGFARIVLEGNQARANGDQGVHLDLDAEAHVLISSLSALGNGGDGLLITSDVVPVHAVIHDGRFSGNEGAGVHSSEGQATLALSRCLLAGNTGGGVLSEVRPALATSSLAWLQPDAPWPGTAIHHSLATSEPVLARLPVLYTRVVAWDEALPDTLEVQTMPDGSGPLEIADDGVPRTLVGLGQTTGIVVDPAPGLVVPPALLTAFGPGDDVIEDYRALPGGPAEGTGMSAPGEPPTDIGPLLAPGVPPGDGTPPVPFWPAAVAPDGGAHLAPLDVVSIHFEGGQPDPAHADATHVVLRDSGGAVLASGIFVLDGELGLAPPPDGWPVGKLVLELFPGLLATDGDPLATPVALPLLVTP